MPTLIDETGNRYGRLTVIERAENTSYGATQWLCRCDCGKEVTVLGNNLRRGDTRSCGCLRKDILREKQTIDEAGNRYGRLLVIGPALEKYRGEVVWLCKCDCGNETQVRGSCLRSGNTKSCGCLGREFHTLPEGQAAFNALYRQYRQQARRRGYKFELTKEQFRNLTQQPCHYCGAEPAQLWKRAEYNGTYQYNGLDRIDPNKGYSIENVVPCCSACNFAKHEMTVNEFAGWLKAVYEHWAKNILAKGLQTPGGSNGAGCGGLEAESSPAKHQAGIALSPAPVSAQAQICQIQFDTV